MLQKTQRVNAKCRECANNVRIGVEAVTVVEVIIQYSTAMMQQL